MKRPVKVKVGDEVTRAGWGNSLHKVTKVAGNTVWIEHRGQEHRYDNGEWIVAKKAPTAKKRPHGPQEYKGNGKHDWESVTREVDEYTGLTERLRVPGGWLYRVKGRLSNPTLTFVPLPEAVGYAV